MNRNRKSGTERGPKWEMPECFEREIAYRPREHWVGRALPETNRIPLRLATASRAGYWPVAK